jgi:hypothetical protein
MTLNPQDLQQFTGSEQFYRWSLAAHCIYTEGVQYVAEQAGAYWLIDAVFSYQGEAAFRTEPFQVWELAVSDSRGRLICWDGNNKSVLLADQDIPFTDFPLPEIKLYLIQDGTYKTLLLTSEY